MYGIPIVILIPSDLQFSISAHFRATRKSRRGKVRSDQSETLMAAKKREPLLRLDRLDDLSLGKEERTLTPGLECGARESGNWARRDGKGKEETWKSNLKWHKFGSWRFKRGEKLTSFA